MICAKRSNPSIGWFVGFGPLSCSKQSFASCIELLIDDHMDSIMDAPSLGRLFGRSSKYSCVISTKLSSDIRAFHGMLTSILPIWPAFTSISHPWFSHNSLSACHKWKHTHEIIICYHNYVRRYAVKIARCWIQWNYIIFKMDEWMKGNSFVCKTIKMFYF